MSLSSYDVLAFGSNGLPCEGTIVSPQGTSVKIYKNWLYVRNEAMWQENMRYVFPTIAEIHDGHIFLAGFDIHAYRSERQGAIFCCITHTTYHDRDDNGNYVPPTILRMAGIGCYGHLDTLDLLQKYHPGFLDNFLKEHNCNTWDDLEQKYDLISQSFNQNEDNDEETGYFLELMSFNEEAEKTNIKSVKLPLTDNQYYEFVGVTSELLTEFKEWLADILQINEKFGAKEGKKYYESINWDVALRVNQGDMFIHNAMGTNPEGSHVGSSEEPILMKYMKKAFGNKNDENKSDT